MGTWSFAHVEGGSSEVERGPGVDTVPGVADLRAEGFVPLQDLPCTWAVLWDLWPAAHRTSVPETRDPLWAPEPERSGAGPDVRLVRSAWPDVTVQRFVTVATRVLKRRHPDFAYERDPALVVAVVRELIADPARLPVRRRRPRAG